MPPLLITYPYESESELKLEWSQPELVGYRCLEEQEAVMEDLDDDDSEGGESGCLRWYIKEDETHAILTYSVSGQPEKLLIDLKLEEAEHVPKGLGREKALQVCGVIAPERDYEGQGYARSLYAVIARCLEVLIVSDTHHHIPGKELWRSLARRRSHLMGRLEIYCYDMKAKKFLSDTAGAPIVYDGSNIPDEALWSATKHAHIVLVAHYVAD